MNNLLFIIIAIFLFLILVFLIFKYPYLGIAFTVSSLPIVDLLPQIPYLTSAVPLIGAITLLSFLIQKRWVTRDTAFNFSGLQIPGLLLILWIFLSNPQAAVLGSSRNWLLTFIQLWVLMYIASNLLDTAKKQQTVMVVFSVFTIISAFYAIQTGSIGTSVYTSTRAVGYVDNANAAARYFVVAMVFLSFLRLTMKSPWMRFFSLLGIIVTYLGVFFTVSRTGILLLVFAQGLILVFQRSGKQRISLIIIFFIALITLLFLSDTILEVIQSIFPTIINRGDTVGLRVNLWKSGWMMWLDHPIRGVGIGRYTDELGPYMLRLEGPRVWSTVAHNTYIQILSETGAIGFCLFIIMISTTVRNFWQSDVKNGTQILILRNAWLIAFIVMLVGGITKSDHVDKLTWMVMGVSMHFHREYYLREKEGTVHPIS